MFRRCSGESLYSAFILVFASNFLLDSTNLQTQFAKRLVTKPSSFPDHPNFLLDG
jgi:hypothetical protein